VWSPWSWSARTRDAWSCAVPLAPGSPPVELQADDLPESQGAPVASALRAGLIRRWLSAADRDRLLAGETTVDRLVVDRLSAELDALEGSSPSRVADRVGLLQALAALARLAGEGIPFDVQTRFHHRVRTLDEEAREHLTPLAELLGFAPGAIVPSEPAPFPAGASAP
jgi:hypothetical protein